MFRHRFLFLAPFALVAALAFDVDISRPGGTYGELSVADAQSCAQACAGDGLCMSWTYETTTQMCALKAVAPAPIASRGSISGLSTRAPEFARLAAPPVVQPTLPADPAPPSHNPPPDPLTLARAASTRPDPSDALLGGPENDVSLRTQLPDDPS